jgi:hypothetical protein
VIVCSLMAAIAFSTLLISDCRPANREVSAAWCVLSRRNKVLAEGVVPSCAAVFRLGRALRTFALCTLRAPDFLRLDDALPMKCPPMTPSCRSQLKSSGPQGQECCTNDVVTFGVFRACDGPSRSEIGCTMGRVFFTRQTVQGEKDNRSEGSEMDTGGDNTLDRSSHAVW